MLWTFWKIEYDASQAGAMAHEGNGQIIIKSSVNIKSLHLQNRNTFGKFIFIKILMWSFSGHKNV